VIPKGLPARLAPLPGWAAVRTLRAASAKSAAAALGLRPGFIDIDRAAAQIGPIQGGDGAVRLGGVRHFDKGKAARAAGVPVGYQVDALHVSIWLEECTEGRFGRAEIQISYKDVFHVVHICFQSCGRDEADSDSARLLQDVKRLPAVYHARKAGDDAADRAGISAAIVFGTARV
jgi:hypothetical protein